MKLSGSEIIVNSLLDIGVSTVFGYPGGQIMPLYDALYNSRLKHILTVHEQGAAHAADGYARATGRAGVCIATSGPGATNLVTGLATAFMDSVPIVAITGQVPTPLLGRDSFQEVDITGITMPITKHSFLIRDIKDLAPAIYESFAIALGGRPGPVLIDVPRDILQAETGWEPKTDTSCQPSATLTGAVLQAIETAAVALATAERPAILIGGGVISSQTENEALALTGIVQAPVMSTLMGLGAIPHDHPRMLGLTGMHGHKPANHAVNDADVLLAVGTRFSDRVTSHPQKYAQNKTVIQLDIDAAEIGKNIASHISITGDLRQTLTALTDRLKTRTLIDYSGWWNKLSQWRHSFNAGPDVTSLTAPWIMQFMSQELAAQPKIWVTDVGQHQMWAAQSLQITEPRSWITSGGLGTMGFGLPAALGAQAAAPAKRVILIAGDGGFKMTGMELYTAVNEQLPVISVIINNRCLGMVRQWQQLFYRDRYSCSLLPAFDFTAFAASCGAAAHTASSQAEFRKAFGHALQAKVPTVIVANIDQQLLVEPMVSPGEPINAFLDI
ncbi:biosynthetic-type acetolactate synthase large subunit|uniref:Acetolactate synthase n=1 Tax=Dendrosporobacter quercicolus TaxID=146817 RepID=A0A1G9UAT7_9FIRM|nr:biosynthetic-type acetolactate synthase large subunit [Dendrosporobacter quercicolus]NSL49935.1 biosynthetic-type acetolactate synthase large subunit [Dendrosporobacter quercicolus DSM 1736]SDM57041.1 acetolactate synthase, large subunit [Dendrosporobacter quercicolus]